MRLQDLVAQGEAMHRELGREYYLTGAGLKAEPAFQAIYARYAVLVGDEALALARASGDPSLLEWAVDVRVSRLVAPFDERQLVWEREAAVHVNGRTLSYLRVPIEVANTPDRAYRLALDAARVRLGGAALTPIRRERFRREHEAVAALALGPDYVTASSRLAGVDLDALGTAAQRFLAETDDLYEDCLARLARRRLDLAVSQLERADSAWLFRADRFDGAFPQDRLVATAVRQMGDMGLDATEEGRVRFDTEEREGKQPRAFCVQVRVPEEVYLVLRPRGGHTDYRTFWHELGHAMHFASVAPALPFAARWLGDNSVTEGFAMLWDHLTLDPGWLARYTGLARHDVQDLVFELAVGELFLARRYAAKLGYELVLHRSDLGDLGGTYAERLTAATRFRYPVDDWLVDVDPGFYAARYLRAWQLEAALATALAERFDVDWYRNPRAGAFVRGLMGRGQAMPADRLAEEATGQPLGFAAVARRLERMLE